jgi:hypothetical protein
MKCGILIFLLVISCLPALSAEKPKPFQVIHLDTLKPDPHGCEVKWTSFVNQMIWTDDDHLVVWLIYSCYSHDSKDRKSPTKLAVFDTTGGVRSIWSEFSFGFLPGPSGTLLIGHGSQADVLDKELGTKQSLKCPMENIACSIFGPLSHSSSSDFALCSYTAIEENCAFYRGFPSEKVSERKLDRPLSNRIPNDPYEEATFPTTGLTPPDRRKAWRVGPSELWYFDDHQRLARMDSKGPMGLVSAQKWTPEYSECTGDLSGSEPRRFLATCVGAHIYTDGELDALFAYSRIALFDVASRQILARIEGPAYTSAVLSPSGKLIAVEHMSKIRFYRAN